MGPSVVEVCAFMNNMGYTSQIYEHDKTLVTVKRQIGDKPVSIVLKYNPNFYNVNVSAEFINVPADKLTKAYEICNRFNRHYAFIKFTVDPESGLVRGEDDGVIQSDTYAEESLELVINLVKTLETVLPAFTSTLIFN